MKRRLHLFSPMTRAHQVATIKKFTSAQVYFLFMWPIGEELNTMQLKKTHAHMDRTRAIEIKTFINLTTDGLQTLTTQPNRGTQKTMWWHDIKKWWTHFFFLNQFAYSFRSCNYWAFLDAIPPVATWEKWKQGWAAQFVSSSMMHSGRRGKMGSSHMLHYISDQLWSIFPFACVHTVCPQQHCSIQ